MPEYIYLASLMCVILSFILLVHCFTKKRPGHTNKRNKPKKSSGKVDGQPSTIHLAAEMLDLILKILSLIQKLNK